MAHAFVVLAFHCCFMVVCFSISKQQWTANISGHLLCPCCVLKFTHSTRQPHNKVHTIIIPILPRNKLRTRKKRGKKKTSQGHLTGDWETNIHLSSVGLRTSLPPCRDIGNCSRLWFYREEKYNSNTWTQLEPITLKLGSRGIEKPRRRRPGRWLQELLGHWWSSSLSLRLV